MNDSETYAHHMGCILKVLIYIEGRFDEALCLEEMAKIACISPYYFHRLFRAYMGETVADYIKRLRLQRAEERLRYSDDAITDIALDVGYETPSGFAKVFQQVMGQSPREYRRAMQPEVRKIMERTYPKQVSLKPQYVTRKEETVFFIRRVGDYKKTPWEAFEALLTFIEKEGLKSKVLKFYSLALDDPSIADVDTCRFDACFSLSERITPRGEVGQRVLKGGRYAVFTYRGPYTGIDDAFGSIFTEWYPTAKVRFAVTDPFCEYIELADPNIAEEDRVTKFYIPLAE